VKTQGFFWTTATAILGMSAIVSAQNASTEPETSAPRSAELSSVAARAAARAAEDLLNRRVDSVDWREKTFEEVLDWLRDQGDNRVNVIAKWNALGVENVNRESLITLHIENTTVAELLGDCFGQLSEEGQVTYHGVGNKLTISTKQDFGRKLYTKVYDATDLMFRVPDFGQGIPQIDLQRAGQSGGGGGGGGGGGQGVFSGAGGGAQQEDNESGQQAEQTMLQRMSQLRNLIQNSIATDTWNRLGQTTPGGQSGGLPLPGTGTGAGRIEIFNRSLVITNTIEVHEMIVDRFALGG